MNKFSFKLPKEFISLEKQGVCEIPCSKCCIGPLILDKLIGVVHREEHKIAVTQKASLVQYNATNGS